MIRIHSTKTNKKATDGCQETKSVLKVTTVGSKTEEQEEKKEKRAPCISSALRILQSGANSSKMLREKLLRKGYRINEVEEALDFVKGEGFVNDRRLLLTHTVYLAERKFYGKSRIRYTLLQKFDHSIVDNFFEEAIGEIDFSALALRYAKKHSAKTKEALAVSLKRQGYTQKEIRYALSSLEEEKN